MHAVRSAPSERGVAPVPSRGRGRHAAPRRSWRRPWATAVAVAGTAGLCAGLAGLIWVSHGGRPAATVGSAGIVPIPQGRWAAVPAPAAAPAVARPVRLEIPAIGVQTSLIRLGLTSAGMLQAPPTTTVAGWYTGSPRPGATGTAVIAGHIDSATGPGVFFRLRLMRPGELVYVRRADGSLAVFLVTAVHTYPKADFPTSSVYGPVPDAQLRIITCGGTFDSTTGHYLSNVIVFATLRT